MNIDAERAAFEACFTTRPFNFSMVRWIDIRESPPSLGNYLHTDVQAAWDAWQIRAEYEQEPQWKSA
jgi:hypothetical protein